MTSLAKALPELIRESLTRARWWVRRRYSLSISLCFCISNATSWCGKTSSSSREVENHDKNRNVWIWFYEYACLATKPIHPDFLVAWERWRGRAPLRNLFRELLCRTHRGAGNWRRFIHCLWDFWAWGKAFRSETATATGKVASTASVSVGRKYWFAMLVCVATRKDAGLGALVVPGIRIEMLHEIK